MRWLLALPLLVLPLQALALDIPEAPSAYILDSADILSSESESQLIDRFQKLEADTGAEIAIVTIPSLEGESLESFAVETFRSWGVGQAGSDNGLLLIVAVEDRKMRIEVGYGLEGRVTDALSSRIISDVLGPAFANGEYELGISTAADIFDGLVREEATEFGFSDPVSSKHIPSATDKTINLLIALFFIAIFQFIVMANLGKKKLKGYQKLPVLIVFTLVVLLFLDNIGLVSWVVAGGAAFMAHMGLRKVDYEKVKKAGAASRRNSDDDPSNGFGGGSSGGSFGGGGFGGGSSGGGGASGSW